MSKTPALETETVTLTPITLTEAERAEALKAADYISVELINEVTASPPPLQSAKVMAAATFKTLNSYLTTLQKAYGDAPIDCTTTAGDKAAREVRLKFVTLRTRANKLRLESNEPFVEQTKANNAAFNMIEDAVLPLEKRFDDAIKAQEAEVARRKKDAEEKAAKRSKDIADAIADLVARGIVEYGVDAPTIRARIQDLTILELVADDFDHRYGEAVTVKDQSLERLETALASAEAAEKRDAQAKLERERFEKERAAHNAIEQVIHAPTRAALEKDADAIFQTRIAITQLDAEGFAPLVDQAFEAMKASIESLSAAHDRKVREAAEAQHRAEQDAIRSADEARRAKEQAARDGIAKMRTDVAECVTASSTDIAQRIEAMNALVLADFEPLAREAADVQEKSLAALRQLKAGAEEREKTEAERQAKIDRAAFVETNVNRLRGYAARHEASGSTSVVIGQTMEMLKNFNVTTVDFDDRAQEAEQVLAAEQEALAALFNKRHAAEQVAAQEKAARDLKAQQEAAENAKRSRTVRAFAANGAGMFDALTLVLADENFNALTEPTRLSVIAILSTIDSAIKG